MTNQNAKLVATLILSLRGTTVPKQSREGQGIPVCLERTNVKARITNEVHNRNGKEK